MLFGGIICHSAHLSFWMFEYANLRSICPFRDSWRRARASILSEPRNILQTYNLFPNMNSCFADHRFYRGTPGSDISNFFLKKDIYPIIYPNFKKDRLSDHLSTKRIYIRIYISKDRDPAHLCLFVLSRSVIHEKWPQKADSIKH